MKARAALLLALAACRSNVPAAALEDAPCGDCHRAEQEAWRGSLHRASFTSRDFQRSFEKEPRRWCIGCHAPLADRSAGVGCAACHTTPADHATRHTRVATTDCRGCHDFDAPDSRVVLQSTAREHEASRYATTACPSCHMPRGSHAFAVTRDPAFLRRALEIGDARWANGELALTVASQGVGHRFPTGDLFRRLTVVVTATRGAADLVAADTFHLARDWDRHRALLRAHEVEPVGEDTRLDDTPRTFRMACPERPARVHVTVVYARGAGASGDDFEAFAELPLYDADVMLRP